MAVRLHLVVLERDGLVSRSTTRRGPGRPMLVYTLTEEAQELFPKNYHVLAELLLEGIKEQGGTTQIETMCHRAADMLAERYAHRMAGKDTRGKLEEITRILNETGCYAAWEKTEEGYLLYEHNCPYYRVAKAHRALCDIDSRFLSLLLQMPVERKECLLDHTSQCTYFIHPT